jgi:hypothetical protein
MKWRIDCSSKFLLAEKLSNSFTLFKTTPIRQSFQSRTEFFNLLLPIEQSGAGGYHQEGTPDFLGFTDVTEQSNCLYGFTESHLVGENAIDSLLI